MKIIAITSSIIKASNILLNKLTISQTTMQEVLTFKTLIIKRLETKAEIPAGRLGIEPRLKASKASVLPLDDLPMFYTLI